MHYLIKDTDFENILKFLMTLKKFHKKDVDKLRIFLEALFYMAKAGCCWRLLPFYYGHYRAVHKKFSSWEKYGIWANLCISLNEKSYSLGNMGSYLHVE